MTLRLVLRLAGLVLATTVLDRWLFSFSRLPVEALEEQFLFAQAVARMRWPDFVFLAAALLCASFFRRLWQPWSAVEHGGRLRMVSGVSLALLAWSFSTYEYNLFLDQSHAGDRLLLVALACLALWRPIFVFPFLAVLMPVVQQFGQPLGGYLWPVDLLPIRVLVVSSVAWVFFGLTGRRASNDWALLLSCVVAVSFWYPGMLKMQLHWWAHEQIAYGLSGAYTQGWLAFLEPETIASATGMLLPINLPMVVGTLCLEAGALFLLWRRGFARTLLVAWMLFHCAAFGLYGFYFWKWLLVEASCFQLLRRGGPAIFERRHFVAAFVLIASGPFWLAGSPNLAWYDTPISTAYRFEAVGDDGRSYTWLPSLFAPFSDAMTMGGLDYLSHEPRLTGPYGVTGSLGVLRGALECPSAAEVPKLRSRLDREGLLPHRYDEDKAKTFDDFVNRVLTRRNRDGGNDHWWHALTPPGTLLSLRSGEVYADQSPVRQLNVRQVTYFYSRSEGYRQVESELVRTVEIPRVPNLPIGREHESRTE